MIRDALWIGAAVVVLCTLMVGVLFAGLVLGTMAGLDMTALPK